MFSLKVDPFIFYVLILFKYLLDRNRLSFVISISIKAYCSCIIRTFVFCVLLPYSCSEHFV